MRLRTLILLATSVVLTLSLSACPGGVDNVASGNAPIELASENTPAEPPSENTPAEPPGETTPAEPPGENTPAEPPSENTPTEPAAAYTIGGTAAGLAPGTRLTLLNNGGDALTVSAAGPFTFASRVPANGSYSVTVADQPDGQTCSVANHSGAGVTANVSSVRVICSAVTHTIGGTVSGLAPNSRLVLNNNGSEALEVAANGVFTFATPVPANGSYAVAISTQPAGQTCSVAGYTGTGVTANVASVQVTCAANTYAIGGTVSGLARGTQVTLANNGGDALTVTANGVFTFATPVPHNGSYAVAIGTQPAGQTCSVAGYTGTGVTANVASVQVTCAANTYAIGGTVSGLASGTQVTLANNGGDALTVTANGAFTFATPVPENGSYAVTVGTQPTGQTCSVANYTGAGVTANVASVQVTCAANTYTIGGTVSGLLPGTQVVLNDNGGDALTVAANGAFTFATPVPENGSYAVTIGTRPTGQTCSVSSGSGTGVAANVASVSIACVAPVYVTNSLDNTVMQYAAGADGALRPLSPATVRAGINSQSVTVDPTGKYAYVANVGVGNISQYSVGADGALTPLSPATVPAGIHPTSVTVDPTGRYVYAANATNNTISQYAVGSGGALTPLSPATVPAGSGSASVTVDPTGKYAYVGNFRANTVSQYSIRADGSLTPLNPATVAARAPSSVTVAPTGRYAYVANYNDNTVSQYSVGAGGKLTPLNPATVATRTSPASVTVDPTGKHVYVANNGSDTVSQYSVGADGALSPLSPATVPAGGGPASVTADATGRYVYAANARNRTISQYAVGADGALTPLSPATVAAAAYSIATLR